jgi:hypothetical protein
MKDILVVLSFLFANVGWGQVTLSVNNFEFTGPLKENGWTAHSGVGTNTVTANTVGLTFANYSGSGIGNAVQLGNASSGEDVNLAIPTQTQGSIYAAMMVNVNDAANRTGSYFFHFATTSGATTSTFGPRIFAQTNANGVNFGIHVNSSTGVYSATSVSRNTTYLLIIKYSITAGGNDPLYLWLFSPGEDFSTEPNISSAIASVTNVAGIESMGSICLRQDNASQPSIIVDGIRIATSWDKVLPVSFTSFSATKDGKNNLLSWSTASEQNNAGFEVQRSTDGSTYENIGFVKSLSATGNSSSPLSYSFTDFNPLGLQQYYRLKQTDLDGKYAYSAIVLVKREAPATFTVTKVYPNPSTSSIYINAACPAATTLQLSILDMNGRVVGRKQVNAMTGNNGFDMPITQLAPGTYLLQVLNADKKVVTTEKFIKQ